MHQPDPLFASGGATGAKMRALDWASTPAGPPASWPPQLRTAVGLCLASHDPIAIFWGADMVLFYNDTYRPLLGTGQQLGQPLGHHQPQAAPIADVLARGVAARRADQPQLVERDGTFEERFFTLAYTPIYDERGTPAGVFASAIDTTARVLYERRLRVLRELGAQIVVATTAERACAGAAEILAAHPSELAFALIYLLDQNDGRARLAGHAGDADCAPQIEIGAAPEGWQPQAIARVAHSGRAEYGIGLSAQPPGSAVAPGLAAALPLLAPGQQQLAGVLLAGINPQRRFDDDYRSFLELVANHIAAAIAGAVAYTADRQRAASEQAADRTARLQAVTAALAETLTAEQVADVVLHQGVTALGGYAGSIALLTDDGSMLEITAAIGYAPDLLTRWQRFPIDAALPLADAARLGELVAIDSIEQWNARYLTTTPTLTQTSAWAAIPLEVDGRVLGAMGLSFTSERRFQAEDRAYMLALAQQCAQALDRARLYEAARQARAAAEAAQVRLAFLAEASRLLASSLDYATTLATLATLATPTLADWCMIDLIGDDGAVRRVAVAHANPEKQPLAEELAGFPPLLERDTPVTRVLHTGQTVLHPNYADDLLALSAYDERQLALVRALGVRSLLIVPLQVRDQPMGAISLIVADSSWRYGPNDQTLAEELAARAAIAIENALLYRETQAAVRARDELLSIVSHDLQNPLATIKLQTQMLSRSVRRAGAAAPRDLAEGLARIDTETTKMTTLISELLDLARLQVGQALDLNRRPTDLVELVRQTVAARGPTPGHQIRVEAALPELSVPLDPLRLERLLGNLLSNAVKYSPDGGEVLVGIAREAGWALLTVRDHGLGIPAADLPYIFERFHRAGNVASRIGGTGIGLWSARQIVELHGGSISVDSQEGAGATFMVRLPL